jgi:hypothetical protein
MLTTTKSNTSAGVKKLEEQKRRNGWLKMVYEEVKQKQEEARASKGVLSEKGVVT